MKEPSLLFRRIKEVVCELEPGAEIILYGSRAREEATPGSDWDLLVLLDGQLTHAREQAIQNVLFDLELETGEVLIPLVKNRLDWNAPRYRVSPFYQNVQREGKVL